MPYDRYPAVDDDNQFPEPVRKAAAKSPEMLEALAKANWVRNNITSAETVDFNTCLTPGAIFNTNSSNPNMPVNAIGVLEVFQLALGYIQRYSTYELPIRVFNRTRTASGNWLAWHEASKNPNALVSNTDLNMVTSPGDYYLAIRDYLNGPVANALGHLEVKKVNNYVIQRFMTYETKPRIFYRVSTTTGGWAAWVASNSDYVYDTSVLGSTIDLNTIRTTGAFVALNTGNVNMPENRVGLVESFKYYKAWIQRYTTWAAGDVYIRTSGVGDADGNVVWNPWVRQPRASDIQTLTSRIDSLASSRSSNSGYKNAYLALNQPAGVATESVAAGNIRWPVTIGVTALRARLHVRNWNWAYNSVTKGAVEFNGLWVGRSNGSNFISQPTKVLDAFSTNANGDEYISKWFDYSFTEDVQHLLSLGFTNAEGQVNFSGRGGCWRTTNPGDASLVSPATTLSVFSPFDVWIELEVPASTPILAGFGDSNTVGTGADLPIHDAWLAEYCRRERAIPFFLSIHGSNASTWTDNVTSRWTRFSQQAKPDAGVYFLHQNDLVDGVSLDILKQRFVDTLTLFRKYITPNVYVATITPGAKTTILNQVRKDYNAWIKTNPENINGSVDFSSVLSSNDSTLDDIYRADNLHFKTAGHKKLAETLAIRPVTPRVLTRSEINKISGI